jgi:L-fuconolactonase
MTHPTRIDAHHHFWHPARGDYDWMKPDDPLIWRAYGPADLAPCLAAAKIEKTVLVQAAPTLQETEYLLGLADATPFVAGVVGWIDFEDPKQHQSIKRLAVHPKFLGLRPMIQNLPDDAWMLRADVQWAFAAICDLDLTFDGLGFPRHIPYFIQLIDRYPQMRTVLDHGLKPQIKDKDWQTWADGIASLSKTGAYIKLSGLVTECGADFEPQTLRRYSDHMLTCFGAERVMWGSDWPVCRKRCDYDRWVAIAQHLTGDLSAPEQDMVWGKSAAAFYRLKETTND